MSTCGVVRAKCKSRRIPLLLNNIQHDLVAQYFMDKALSGAYSRVA